MKNIILWTQGMETLGFFNYPFESFKHIMMSNWSKEGRVVCATMSGAKFGFVITKIN